MKHLSIVVFGGLVGVTVAFGQNAGTPAGIVGVTSRPTTTQATTHSATTQSTTESDEAQVRKALKMVVNDVQMQHLPLLEAFDRVRELSNQNIYIDVKSLRGEGVTTSAKVTYKTDKATVAEVLTEIIKPLNEASKGTLGFDVMGKTIVISTKGRLRDLVVQYHTDIYKLGDPAVAKILNTPIEDLKIDYRPFRESIAQLAKMTSQTIKLDKDSVIAAGVSMETPITVQAKGLTLGQALRLVMHDAEGNAPLDYNVEDGKVLVFGPAPQ